MNDELYYKIEQHKKELVETFISDREKEFGDNLARTYRRAIKEEAKKYADKLLIAKYGKKVMRGFKEYSYE